jgi:hypothetical protein
MSEDSRYLCTSCYGGTVPLERWKLGYSTCLPCGQAKAMQRKFTVAPINKSNYMLLTDVEDLKHLNPKRTT